MRPAAVTAVLLFVTDTTAAWIPTPCARRVVLPSCTTACRRRRRHRRHRNGHDMVGLLLPPTPTCLALAPAINIDVTTWRQYVPLVVSCLVIGDILLGSPAAKAAMSFARPKEDYEGERKEKFGNVSHREHDGSRGTENSKDRLRLSSPSRERIDTTAVAKAAIDKANATLELRSFLDARKTDWDRMEDMRRSMDEQLQNLDEKLLVGIVEETKNNKLQHQEENNINNSGK
jgi:hypothetical protein